MILLKVYLISPLMNFSTRFKFFNIRNKITKIVFLILKNLNLVEKFIKGLIKQMQQIENVYLLPIKVLIARTSKAAR